MLLLRKKCWEFPGSPVVRVRCFHCCGLGSVPDWGTKISQAARCGQKKKKKMLHGNSDLDVFQFLCFY